MPSKSLDRSNAAIVMDGMLLTGTWCGSSTVTLNLVSRNQASSVQLMSRRENRGMAGPPGVVLTENRVGEVSVGRICVNAPDWGLATRTCPTMPCCAVVRSWRAAGWAGCPRPVAPRIPPAEICWRWSPPRQEAPVWLRAGSPDAPSGGGPLQRLQRGRRCGPLALEGPTLLLHVWCLPPRRGVLRHLFRVLLFHDGGLLCNEVRLD